MRSPSVFVRDLLPEEGNRLKRLSRKAASEVKRERALIVWASATRMSPQQIAALVGTDESHVRKVIHAFNERGFSSLDPESRGGRPRRITDEQRARIVAVAGARPDTLRGPGHALVAQALGSLSARAADRRGLSGASRTDPRRRPDCPFSAPARGRQPPTPTTRPRPPACSRSTQAAPDDGVVVSFDQMGPISLRPTRLLGWAPRKRPERQRATFTRRHGVRYVFGAYDVHADRLRVRLRPRRRGSDNLAFLKQIRASYPRRLRIYWIQDNLSANWTPDIRDLRRRQQHRARPDPDLRQLPEPHRVSLPADQRVRRQERRLPRLGRLRARARRHVTYRNGPHRDQRLIRPRTPPPDRRLTHAITQQDFRDGALGGR